MDLLDRLLEFEKEHNLFKLQYKGIFYWHFIRTELFAEIIYKDNANNFAPDYFNISFIDKLGFIPFIIGSFKHYIDKNQYDLLVSYNYIRKDINGRRINPYTHFIIDEYNYKVKNFTLFTANWTKEYPDYANSALVELFWMPFFIWTKFILKMGIKRDDNLKQIINLFNASFDCNLNYNRYFNMVYQDISKYKLLRRYYLHIIKNKYRAIYLGYHRNIYHFSLIDAARECGIPTIEHQHGLIGKDHISYNFLDTGSTGKYLPDYLFTFGDYWIETCRFPECIKLIPVGSPQMDASKIEFINDIKNDNAIVFISNGLIGSEMSRFAINFSNLATPLGYHIIYKMHPTERITWRERYPWLADADNIDIVDEPVNIHGILSKSQHIIVSASTVAYEAIIFNCNIYMWKGIKGEFLLDLPELGITPHFDTEHELLDLIKNSSPIKNEKIKDMFFLPNSIKNIEDAFNEIMENK